MEAHESFDAEIWEEFKGISEGANIGVNELLLINGYTDFRDLFSFTKSVIGRQDSPGDECTSFVAPSLVTDGKPIVGQTWDMHQDSMDYAVMGAQKTELRS